MEKGIVRKFAVGNGIKWLSPYGSTIYNGEEFFYNLPAADEKWSKPTAHPNPAEPDGRHCGLGRLHLMNVLSNPYCPGGYPWWVKYDTKDIVGASGEKTSVTTLRLRRISMRTFWKMLRLGWAKGANLTEADLTEAEIDYAVRFAAGR